MKLDKVGGPLLAGAVLVALLLTAGDSTALIAEQLRAGDGPTMLRFSVVVVAVIDALVVMIAADRLSERGRRWAVRLAIGLLLVCTAEKVVRTPADIDEMLHLHMAWMVHDGAVPYRDFFYHHQLLWLLFGQPLFWLYHDDLGVVTAGRLLTGTIMLASLGAVAGICRTLELEADSAGVLLLALPFYILGSFEYRPDPLANLLCLLAVWRALQSSGRDAGLLLGAAVICSPKAMVAGVTVVCILIGQRGLRSLPGLAGWTAVPVLASWVWAASLGVLRQHLLYSYYFNSAFVQEYAHATLLGYSNIRILCAQLAAQPVLPLAVLLGMVGLAARPDCRGMLIGTLLAAAVFFFTKSCARQYVLFPLSMLAVVGAGALNLGAEKRGLASALKPLALILTAALALLGWAAHPPEGNALGGPRLALQACPPGGLYYGEENAGFYDDPIFRRDASFYCQPQNLMTRIFQYSGLVPPHHPPLDPPLVEHPPDVMVVTSQSRLEAFLQELASHGIHYTNLGGGVWSRTRTP